MALQDRVMEETNDRKNAVEEAYVYDMRNKVACLVAKNIWLLLLDFRRLHCQAGELIPADVQRCLHCQDGDPIEDRYKRE